MSCTHEHTQVVDNIIKPVTRNYKPGSGGNRVGERFVSLTQEAINEALTHLPQACREAPSPFRKLLAVGRTG